MFACKFVCAIPKKKYMNPVHTSHSCRNYGKSMSQRRLVVVQNHFGEYSTPVEANRARVRTRYVPRHSIARICATQHVYDMHVYV